MTDAQILENASGFAKDMLALVDGAREIQTRFLAERRMDWIQARALGPRAAEALQADYREWLELHMN